MRPAIHAVAAVVILAAAHGAAARNGGPVGLGQASISCGTWMADRRSPPLAITDDAWLLGFISAFNLYMLNVDGDVARGTDNKGLITWIGTYCQAHPLDNLEDAASTLINELLRRSGAR